jgi:hypothetical protein
MERAKRMTFQAGGPCMPPEADDKIMSLFILSVHKGWLYTRGTSV